MTLNSKKRQRVGSSSRLPTFSDQKLDIMINDESDFDFQQEKYSKANKTGGFNDATTADVFLFLHRVSTSFDKDSEESVEVDQPFGIHLHSNVLKESRYFAALLSDRWQASVDKKSEKPLPISLNMPVSRRIESYFSIFQLFYSKDFAGIITEVSDALTLLPIASELLYDECISYCIRFLEAVPWTEEEEREVIKLVPYLKQEEAAELLARISPVKGNVLEDMLNGLIFTATHCHSNGATVKAFVAKLLRDYSSRDAVRLVLDKAFTTSLKSVKDSLEEYSSPNLRGDHDEIEAMQRMNLHTASVNARHLLWLIERMIELKVADSAVKEWSDQATFTANLHRTFRDDAWRNIVPGLPGLVLRCTYRLANSVVSGTILAARQVRMKLVKDWLPVLIVCRDGVSPTPSSTLKFLYQDLEDVFLQIISTLPMPDAQVLLQQCLSFATRNVDDCTHLVTAFNTWFRRASHAPQPFSED